MFFSIRSNSRIIVLRANPRTIHNMLYHIYEYIAKMPDFSETNPHQATTVNAAQRRIGTSEPPYLNLAPLTAS